MRLISLATVNFKKLGTFFTEFKDGLNIIAGENFKGKSTLLQAIEAAFFGATVVPGKKELIPTHGQTTWSLTLKFAMGEGVHYTLLRNKTTAKLTRHTAGVGDELVANGNTAVTAEIEQMFGLASRDYNLFVQTRQGESSGILTFGATALNRKVEEFAGVDLIDKVQAEAQRRATSYSGKADAKAVAEEVMAEAVAEMEAATDAANAAGAAVEAARKAAEELPPFTLEQPKAASDLRAAVQFANDLGNKLNNADVAYQVADDRLTETEVRFAKLSLVCIDSQQAELDSLHTQGTALRDELKVLQEQDGDYSRASTKLAGLQAAYDAKYADFDLEGQQENYGITKGLLAEKNVKLTAANELVGTTKAAHQNLKDLATGAKCPTCGRAKEDHDPVKLEAEAAAAKTAWDNAKAAVTTLKAELDALEDEFLRLGTTLKDQATAAKALREAEEALAALTPIDKAVLEQKAAAHEEVRGAWAAANQKLKAAAESNTAYRDEEKLLNQRKDELTAADNLVKELKRQWDELPTPPTAEDVAAAEQAEAEYRTAHETWKEQRAALASALDAAIAACSHQVKLTMIATNRVTGYDKKNQEARADLQLSQKYSRLVQFLRTRRQEYMKDVWDTIMAVSSKLVRVSSKGTITALTNEDGDFHFVEEGISAPTTSASGAQKSFIGTAVKVGLARALYGSDSLLVFDEPTSDCSEQYASSLAAMIASSARQVLLITHRETDQSLADHIINVGD